MSGKMPTSCAQTKIPVMVSPVVMFMADTSLTTDTSKGNVPKDNISKFLKTRHVTPYHEEGTGIGS